MDFLLSTVFEKVNLDNVITVSCGYGHSLILTKKGLYGCGDNTFGQIGSDQIVHFVPYIIPIQNVLSIGCGDKHSIILTENGLYGLGNQHYGQLGIGYNYNRTSYPVKIGLKNVLNFSCGLNHTVVLTKENVYSFGQNNCGQLGHDNYSDCHKPKMVKVGYSYDKEVVKWAHCSGDTTIFVTKYNFYCSGVCFNQDGKRNIYENPKKIVMPLLL